MKEVKEEKLSLSFLWKPENKRKNTGNYFLSRLAHGWGDNRGPGPSLVTCTTCKEFTYFHSE